MIFLYSSLLLLLGAAKLLVGYRAASLARKHVKAARAADQFLRAPLFKEGNSGRPDPGQAAKRQYLLGLLVQKRDRLEDKHHAWQAFADTLGRTVARIRGWRGKKLPYTLGVVDVWLLLYAIDYFGVGDYFSARRLVQVVTSLVSN